MLEEMRNVCWKSINKVVIINVMCLVLGSSFSESVFRFEDCSDNATGIFQVNNFTVEPDPIDLMNNVSITANIELLKSITSNFILDTKYFRLARVFGYSLDIPIPCIASKYGSCTLPACTYLESFQKNVCPFFPNEMECKCPVEEGFYGGENVQIRIAYIPLIGRFFVKGRYRTELRIKEMTNETEVACFKIFTDLD